MTFGKYERFIRSIPKIYRPGQNPVITALLNAFSSSDEEVCQQIENSKAQLFIRRAEGKPLDQLANSLGVSRPVALGLDDETFQELIPNLSLKAKQIRKAFYDTSDVFWGPLFSRANMESSNAAPFDVSPGDILEIQIDTRDVQTLVVLAGEVAIPGAATADEMATILAKTKGATTSVITDSVTGLQKINIRTNTPGPLGSVEVFDTSTMTGSGELELPVTKTELRDQNQRVMIYEIRPNELTIEIPAVVPTLRRTLKGSHHFHQDETIEPPVAPSNKVWQGSFLFDPNGQQSSFSVTGQNAKLDQIVQKGTVLTSLVVDDTSKITDEDGFIVFDWGTAREEASVRIRGVTNSKTILIDPAYVFQNDHPVGSYINIIADQKAYTPRKDGTDLAIYLTSPSNAREAVQEILKTLAAAGIILNFVILAPEYKYLQNNPYLSDDDPPQI